MFDTYLSDDSEESYLSVQRFFLNESADSSAIDLFELVALPTRGLLCCFLTGEGAAVIGIIEISLSWSAPFPCADAAVFVSCCFDACIITILLLNAYSYRDKTARRFFQCIFFLFWLHLIANIKRIDFITLLLFLLDSLLQLFYDYYLFLWLQDHSH